MKQVIVGLILLVAASGSTSQGQTSKALVEKPLPNFDIRVLAGAQTTVAAAEDKGIVERRRANLHLFASSPEQSRRGVRLVPNEFGLPKLYLREGGALSDASALKPPEVAKTFLRSQREVFSMDSRDIDGLRLAVEDSSGDARFVTFNQTVNGIDVFNGQIKFTIDRDGAVVQVAAGDLVPGLNISTTPRLSREAAIAAAFKTIGRQQTSAPSRLSEANGRTSFTNPNGAGLSPITTELAVLPMNAATARLAYRIFLEVNATSWYELLIEAETGALLFRHNLYKYAAQANVWTESPMKGTRTTVTFPDAWLPQAGTVSTGNNVDAYLDANGNDAPDNTSSNGLQNGRASSATQSFDFPFGDGTVNADPRLFAAAAVTNVFYFVNTAHDYFYNLGFTEAAGNFQTSNLGRGGTGNDAVVAESQHGLLPNNAAFAPTPEGIAPKMRMGIFTRGTSSNRTDDLDSDYDGLVVIHEYTHGVSTRLVGGLTSTSCLDGLQGGALGEGWSDYFASSFFNNPVQGAYIAQNPTTGVRRFSYEGYPLTYEDFGGGPDGYNFHDDGEIWAGTLWDLRKSLGQTTTDRLVMNGLKATPCNPSMTDARDAILSADQAANGGANRTAIWTVFARHGMGSSAVGIAGNGITGTRYDAAYDLPADLQPNRGPAITSDPLAVRPGVAEAYRYTVVATNPAAGTLTYVLSGGPADMTVNPATGAVNWIATFVGPRVKITVTDGKGGRIVHGFSVPVVTRLSSGQTIIISGPIDSTGYATINVPAGTPVLQVKLRGGSGDADLFVKGPTTEYVFSAHDGSTETLSFANPAPGDWQVEIDGYLSYSGVSLSASLLTPTALPANTTLSGLSGDLTSETFYRVAVPAGVSRLAFSTSGGTGDVDLHVRANQPAVCQPSFTTSDCLRDRSSENDGNSESIEITNPTAGDWYVDLVGYLGYTDVKLTVVATLAPLTLSTPGTATTATTGTAATVSVGYATATLSGTVPYATAVFSVKQNGIVVSEAGVPASPPVRGARVFIDYRTAVQTGGGPIDVLTGLALANPNASATDLTFTLRDRGGNTLTTGHGSLPARAHRARFVDQLKDLAPDFAIPANFSTAVQYGSLEVSSSQPVSVLGLRLTLNQRGDTLLTSTAVTDLAEAASTSTLYFPQLADGAGYRSTIILSNTTGVQQSGKLSVADDEGAALSVRRTDGVVAAEFDYSIPPRGTYVFETDGSPSTTRVGWVKVVPSTSNNTPSGAGVLSYSPGGILVTESGIPSSVATTRARVYVDQANGHDTGLALVNPGAGSMNVTVQAFNPSGTAAGAGTGSVAIPAQGHRSRFIRELISGLPAGFTGVAELSSSTPFVPLTLRTLNNARNDFLLTTFPAADVTRAAPTPIVFPQIADGGGYSTQFVFISATGAATVNVDFIGDDGTPMTIGRAF